MSDGAVNLGLTSHRDTAERGATGHIPFSGAGGARVPVSA